MALQRDVVALFLPRQLQRDLWRRRRGIQTAVIRRWREVLLNGGVERIVGHRHHADFLVRVRVEKLLNGFTTFQVVVDADFAKHLAIPRTAFVRQQARHAEPRETEQIFDGFALPDTRHVAVVPAGLLLGEVEIRRHSRHRQHVAAWRGQVEIRTLQDVRGRASRSGAATSGIRRDSLRRHARQGQGADSSQQQLASLPIHLRPLE